MEKLGGKERVTWVAGERKQTCVNITQGQRDGEKWSKGYQLEHQHWLGEAGGED